MIPTMKLRQVQRGWRQIGPLIIGGPANREPIYVLQQWWEGPIMKESGDYVINTHIYKGEWRDIPIEVEE